MNIDPGFGQAAPGSSGIVGGYDPRMLTQRRQMILQKVMANHLQNKQRSQQIHPGISALQAATAAQVGGGPTIGGSHGRPNAAHVNVTGGQAISPSILARLGLTIPRGTFGGEHSGYPGGAIERTDVGGQMPRSFGQPTSYPGDPGAPQAHSNPTPQGIGTGQPASQQLDPIGSPTGGATQGGNATFQGIGGLPTVDPGADSFPHDAISIGQGVYFSPTQGYINLGSSSVDPTQLAAGSRVRGGLPV